MTLSVLALLLLAGCAVVLARAVAPAPGGSARERALTPYMAPLVLCRCWPEVVTRPG